MPPSAPSSLPPRRFAPSPRCRFAAPPPPPAFTLIELMVAVSLLTVIILSIGVVFKSTGNAVGLGEATGEMFAKVRTINQQITADVHGIDRNGFLIIRCRADNTDPQRFRRFDQISFFSTGKFPNRTGAYQSASIFADNTTSSSARIWYGQLKIAKDAATADENAAPVATDLPTSSVLDATSPSYESGFILGRQAMLLLNPPSPTATVFPAGYADITSTAAFYSGTTSPSNATSESSAAPSIAASRVGVAYTTVPQIMSQLAGAIPVASTYCYRLRSLPSPTTTAIVSGGSPYLPNGILRMHPIFAGGVASFAVDWTNGVPDMAGNLTWFGMNTGAAASYGVETASGTTLSGVPNEVIGPAPDGYDVIFTPANPTKWPKALRFTYRITDANDRLNGGRSFVCIVDLP